MTPEQKGLLLKDLCARLPYGVKIDCCKIVNETLTLIDYKGLVNNDYDIDEVKPYLLPLSSMTEEQGKELEEIDPEFYSLICGNGDIYVSMDVCGYDWRDEYETGHEIIPIEVLIEFSKTL